MCVCVHVSWHFVAGVVAGGDDVLGGVPPELMPSHGMVTSSDVQVRGRSTCFSCVSTRILNKCLHEAPAAPHSMRRIL